MSSPRRKALLTAPIPRLEQARREANLDRLLAGLGQPTLPADIHLLCRELPLVHVTGFNYLKDELSEKLDDAAVRSQADLSRGVDPLVYFYVGAARRAYRNTARLEAGEGRAALLLAPSLEDDHHKQAVAYPWDTGEVRSHWPAKAVPSRNDLLDGAQLPVPEYRTYLGAFLIKAFDDPTHYFRSTRTPHNPPPGDPTHSAVIRRALATRFGKVQPYAPGWTFEVSITGPVQVTGQLVAVVIDRRDIFALGRDHHRALLRYLNNNNTSLVEVDLSTHHYSWRYQLESKVAEVVAATCGCTLPQPFAAE